MLIVYLFSLKYNIKNIKIKETAKMILFQKKKGKEKRNMKNFVTEACLLAARP